MKKPKDVTVWKCEPLAYQVSNNSSWHKIATKYVCAVVEVTNDIITCIACITSITRKKQNQVQLSGGKASSYKICEGHSLPPRQPVLRPAPVIHHPSVTDDFQSIPIHPFVTCPVLSDNLKPGAELKVCPCRWYK